MDQGLVVPLSNWAILLPELVSRIKHSGVEPGIRRQAISQVDRGLFAYNLGLDSAVQILHSRRSILGRPKLTNIVQERFLSSYRLERADHLVPTRLCFADSIT